MNFTQYFKELGFSEREADIYISLYKLGNQPASTISNNTGYERTAIYKILIKLSKLNLVSITKKGNVKYFFIKNNNNLKSLVDDKYEKYKKLKNNFSNIDSELNQLKYKKNSSTPNIYLYDGIAGVENIYSDFGIKIESDDLANSMHCIFDSLD